MSYVMPQSQPQGQVPYDRLLVAPVQFPMNMPPCLIPVQTSQSLAPYMTMLTAMVANDAAQRVSQGNVSPVRVIFWNLVSANNFQNETFRELVDTAADLLLFYMVSGQGGYNSPDQALGAVAAHANNICASHLFVRLNGVQSLVTPQQVNEGMQMLNRASEIQNHVRSIKQQNGIPWNPNQSAGGQPSVVQQPPVYGGMASPQTAVAYSQGSGLTVAPSQQVAFRHQPQPVQVSQPNHAVPGSSPTDRHANAPVAAAPAAQVAVPVQPTAVTTKTMETPVKVDRYFIARNAGKDMDRKKHTIVTTAQRAFAMRPAERESLLEDAVDNLLEAKQELAAAAADDNTDAEAKEATLRQIMLEHNYTTKPSGEVLNLNYLDATVAEIRRGMMLETVNGRPADIVQRTAIIAEPMICSKATAEKLREVTKAGKIGEFAARLKQLMNNTDNTMADRLALLQLDAYLTYEINSLLANGMSLTTSAGAPLLTLDSFADDVPPTDAGVGLMRYIEDKYGYEISRALGVYQREWIGAHCDMVDTERASEYVDESWGENVIVFDRRYSITLVNMLASELNVDFTAPCANAILESEFPVLFKLIHDTLATYEEEGQAIACHLLVTADNQRFRMHRGLIGMKFVLLERLPR